MVRISENKMAASIGYRRRGCIVTSQANSVFLHKSRNDPACSRVARYSGKYRPAWRIIQTGVRSTGCLSKARRKRSFFKFDTLFPYRLLHVQVVENAFRCLAAFPNRGDNEVTASHHITPCKYFWVRGLELVGLEFLCHHTIPIVQGDLGVTKPIGGRGLKTKSDNNRISREHLLTAFDVLGTPPAVWARCT